MREAILIDKSGEEFHRIILPFPDMTIYRLPVWPPECTLAHATESSNMMKPVTYKTYIRIAQASKFWIYEEQ